ncbi:hypothetical protein GCM10029992_02000 [Glycomyces albus]
MANLDIDPESMRQAADQLDAAKEEVQSLIDQFNTALEQFADAFGGDEIGMLVGMAHQACTEVLNECFTTNIEELSDYSQIVREMADDHQGTDEDAAQIFERLLGELGDGA